MRCFLIGAVLVAVCCSRGLSPSSERQRISDHLTNQRPLTSDAPGENQDCSWSRKEFIKLVIGKTQEDVLMLVGQPIKKSEDSWSYMKKTWHGAKVLDHCVNIHWIDGVAKGLTYHESSPSEGAE